LASTDKVSAAQADSRGPVSPRPGLETSGRIAGRSRLEALSSDAAARHVFIWPALIVVLFLSIFPLIVSLYLSLSRLALTSEGVQVDFRGLLNYQILLFGTEQSHFLGVMRLPSPVGWAIFLAVLAFVTWALWHAIRNGIGALGVILRVIGGLLLLGLIWLLVESTFAPGGRPGTLFVTVSYVFVDMTVQYLLALGLALLVTERLAGRRFFRVVFLIPMMITPVGVAYLFEMLTDTGKGPFVPVFAALGMQSFTWTNDPWGARIAVMIGDIWQWTPFMFIVLLAALEGQDQETVEAAHVDGATRWQVFRHITLPAMLPVTTTVLLIRMIEAFKIIDLPNILTNGGPGTATESLTLEAFFDWRTLNLGRSAAVAYLLLIVVTIVSVAYVNLIRRRVTVAV
jgi:multiple sugar transport system permease protein